jgi:hypothetical protein
MEASFGGHIYNGAGQMSRREIRPRSERGQSLVESAMVLPILVMLLLGVVDIGRVVWANDGITQAAREAARWAIVHGGSTASITPCPAGPPSPMLLGEGRLPIASGVCPYPTSPSKDGVREVARKYLVAGGDVDVQVCYGEGCSGNTDTGTNERGEPVTVTVLSTVELVGGGLIGIGSVDLSADVTMTVSH